MKIKKILILMLSLSFILVGCQKGKDDIKLKKDELVFTYGETIVVNLKDIIETKDRSIIETLSVDTSSIPNEKGKTYPAIGEYIVHIQNKDKSIDKELKIKVEKVKKTGGEAEEENTKKVEEKNSKPVVKDGLTYYKGILVVNKKHPLPSDYAPGEDAEAGKAIHELIEAMQLQGYDINDSYSGYRSYERQEKLYNNYVSAHGQKEADTFSARPGYSEHQSGLAFDLLHNDGSLVEKEAEAKWILDNAHLYGFIVRYQKGKEAITGYQAEPWHLRYIGEKAKIIKESGLTLEEYLGAPGGDYAE